VAVLTEKNRKRKMKKSQSETDKETMGKILCSCEEGT
jgi:hypothetical protein